MKITVAICTWNRARLLDQTLQSLSRLKLAPSLDWELLLVNNNCTDHTDAIVQKYRDRLPLRRVFETQQGHSQSRNRAVSEAQGKYIVWTDDDVVVDPEWLSAYAEAFRTRPEAAFWGGVIEPRFESPPPRWLEQNWHRCSGMYAARTLGDEEFAFDERRLPFGANYAIRTALQRKFRYDPRFGRVTDQVLRGFDEIAVLRQLLSEGHQGYWVPAARLQHVIPPDRMTIGYLRRYYEGQGETWIVRSHVQPSVSMLVSRWLRHECGYLLCRLLGRRDRWFGHVVEASRARGQLRCRQEASESVGLPATRS